MVPRVPARAQPAQYQRCLRWGYFLGRELRTSQRLLGRLCAPSPRHEPKPCPNARAPTSKSSRAQQVSFEHKGYE
jgi:hypothetical protein